MWTDVRSSDRECRYRLHLFGHRLVRPCVGPLDRPGHRATATHPRRMIRYSAVLGQLPVRATPALNERRLDQPRGQPLSPVNASSSGAVQARQICDQVLPAAASRWSKRNSGSSASRSGSTDCLAITSLIDAHLLDRSYTPVLLPARAGAVVGWHRNLPASDTEAHPPPMGYLTLEDIFMLPETERLG